jgi:predicted dehydrogenase
MARQIRWGILSTANHALKILVPAIREAKFGEVVAIVSRDAAKAQQAATEHGIPTSYGSYEALLADPNVDVIYNPLPNGLHKEWTIKIAQAGKHCLTEKPMALNAADAQEMVTAFRQAGKKLAEAFQWRHHPQCQYVRDTVRAGGIGDLRLIEAGFSFMLDRPKDVRWDPALGGGALYDVGCYPISVVRYITGAEPLSVTSHVHWHKRGVDDLVVATLEFPGEVFATINCAFILPLRRYYEVVGTTGSLMVPRTYNPTKAFVGQVIRRGVDRETLETIRFGRKNSYALMVEDFNRAVIEDRDPLFPGEDGVKNMRVIDAIFQSAREGRAVTL